MHPLSSAKKENIFSLASNGHSTCLISSRVGVSQSAITRILKDILPNQHLSHGGCPPKLSSINTPSIIQQITTDKASNAVQATKYINSIISNLNK